MVQVGRHKQGLALAHAAAEELAQGTMDKPFDFRNPPPALAGANADADPVILKGLEYFTRRKEYLAAIIEDSESIARFGGFDHRFGAYFFRIHPGFQAFKPGERIPIKHC